MKITYNISTALVLGSALVAASPALAGEVGVGSVELIPFPEGASNWVNAYFSDDGQVQLLHTYTQSDSDIYRYVDGEWVLIRRELQTIVPGITPFDVSDDGSRVLLSDFYRTDVIDGSVVYTMPKLWTYSVPDGNHSHSELESGSTRAGEISGDGRVVTLMGQRGDEFEFDSLIWANGEELINISDGLPRAGYTYNSGIPSHDGSVVVFGGSGPDGTHNWVWEQGSLTEIPMLDPVLSTGSEVRLISADGHAAFGTEFGPNRGGLSYQEPLGELFPWTNASTRASTAWVWTRDRGTEPVHDPKRFLETFILDIDAAGSRGLVYARLNHSNITHQYLWLGGTKFIQIDELLHSLNIPIDADSYDFNEISDDGTKLMGLASVDGQIYSHAIIVTIPDLTP